MIRVYLLWDSSTKQYDFHDEAQVLAFIVAVNCYCAEKKIPKPQKNFERIEDMQNKEKKQNTIPKCKQFNCDKLHGNYCCFYCIKKDGCKNHCLNTPEKCNLAVPIDKQKAGNNGGKEGDRRK